jgi:hypothetical protein
MSRRADRTPVLARKTSPGFSRHSSEGRVATALAPPAYGIDFVDRANHTGMPDRLKAGIEALSGIDMSPVRVHANSARPARFHAHALAQGNEIHLAPGQERHLPHEAWHLVQQAQGRVKGTLSLRGAQINDDLPLENEATEMGSRALRLDPRTAEASSLAPFPGAGPSAPMQLAWYVRSIQTPNGASMNYEIQRLLRASPLDTGTFGGLNEYGQPVEINKWLAGGAGLSTTHYNPGQNQYYAPVGFVVDVQDANVLGHFLGDGNTSTLHANSARYWGTFEIIRAGMVANGTVHGEINARGYAADFANAIVDRNTADALRGRIEAFMADGNVTDPTKDLARGIIRTAAVQQLQDHYQNGGFQGAIGPGGPGGLAPLEGHLQGLAPGAAYRDPVQGRDVKYTESQVHAQLAHVVGTFYAAEMGDYPDLIDATWRNGDPNWLDNRVTAATDFRNRFIAAGNRNTRLLRLEGGQLDDAPRPAAPLMPEGFLPWALAAVGVAVLWYGIPALMRLYQQYLNQ